VAVVIANGICFHKWQIFDDVKGVPSAWCLSQLKLRQFAQTTNSSII